VARSGTAAFVAVDPPSRTPEVASAVRDAFALAVAPRPAQLPVAEPLDWLDRSCPARWRTPNGVVEYTWSGPDGADPFAP
jgi:alpha-galactosidase